MIWRGSRGKSGLGLARPDAVWSDTVRFQALHFERLITRLSALGLTFQE